MIVDIWVRIEEIEVDIDETLLGDNFFETYEP